MSSLFSQFGGGRLGGGLSSNDSDGISGAGKANQGGSTAPLGSGLFQNLNAAATSAPAASTTPTSLFAGGFTPSGPATTNDATSTTPQSSFGRFLPSSAATTQPATNVFGGNATSAFSSFKSGTATNSSGNLFGGAKANDGDSAAPPGTGLFQNLTNPATSASTTGITTTSAFGPGGGFLSSAATTTSAPETATTGISTLGGNFAPSTAAATTSAPTATTTATSTLGGGFMPSAATTSQPATNAFGGTATGTSSVFGLFGGDAAAKPSGNTSGDVNTTATSVPATTTSSTSNFGGGLLTSMAAVTQPGTSSLLGGSTIRPSQSTGAFFDSLLEKSKKQADGETALEDLPRLQLGLGDMRQRLRKLGTRKDDRVLDGKAHYILAASGVDPITAAKDLDFLGLPASRLDRAAATSVPEVDVEAYLVNLQSKTTLSMIADGLERSLQDFDSFLEDNVAMEWEAQRKRIYDHFGINLKEDTSVPDAAGDSTSRSFGESQGGFGRSRRFKNGRASVAPGPKGAGSSRLGASLRRSIIGAPAHSASRTRLEFSDVTAHAEPDSVSMSGPVVDDRSLRAKQAKYAEQVREINIRRLRKEPCPVLSFFAHVVSTHGNGQTNPVLEAYKAVMEMVEEDAGILQDPTLKSAKEREYANAYFDPNSNSQAAMGIRTRILAGACKFLENQFFDEVEAVIAKFPREANLGGRPDVVSKIKAYIRIRMARKDLTPDNTNLQQVGDDYVWAVIYYLLRSGHVREAANYINTCTGFRSIDRTFGTYLNDYASRSERRLRKGLQERCNNEYTQRLQNAPRDSIDPFRVACYKIVGRCQLQERTLSGLNTDVADWTWLQFNLAREMDKSTELASEMYTLANLQETISDIGQKHFPKTPAEDTNGTASMFFYLQILAGMFEQAIAYLYNFSYVEAVHFAIALEFYGLLRPADAKMSDQLLSMNSRDQPLVNFGRMLGYYTRDFRATDAEAAVDYLVLICLNRDLKDGAGKAHTEICHEALRELVLETREFTKLIGDVRANGQHVSGIIEEYSELIGIEAEDDFVRAVTLQAASYADESGRTTDSVLLYHLAADYDSVMAIVNRALSEAVAADLGDDTVKLVPAKPGSASHQQNKTGQKQGNQASEDSENFGLASIDDPVDLATAIFELYSRDAMVYKHIRSENKTTCAVLLAMNHIKTMVAEGMWTDSLDEIQKLDILPLDAKGDPGAIRHYATRFGGLSQPVGVNVGNLILWTVECCSREKERLLSSKFGGGNEGTRAQMIRQLSQMILDLTAYTSQLRYRFPPYLHEALARASVD